MTVAPAAPFSSNSPWTNTRSYLKYEYLKVSWSTRTFLVLLKHWWVCPESKGQKSNLSLRQWSQINEDVAETEVDQSGSKSSVQFSYYDPPLYPSASAERRELKRVPSLMFSSWLVCSSCWWFTLLSAQPFEAALEVLMNAKGGLK